MPGNIMNFSLYSGSDGDVLSKVLCGKPDPRPIKQKSQNYIIDTIQEKIKNGTYETDIVPSDLVDFGGQRSFDMTHQLFMQHKGTFVLMFNGTIDLLKITNDERETTECKLVSDFLNLIFFLLT